MESIIKHPSTFFVAGATQTGKTEFTKRLLHNIEYIMGVKPDRIVWCYGVWQPGYESLRNSVEFNEGFPEDIALNPALRNVLILDDLMTKVGHSRDATNLFIRGGHHFNTSIIYIVQNMFYKAPEIRTISLNSHILVLFKNPRDRTQILHLARQIYPANPQYLIDAYHDATARNYGYLLIDVKPCTPEELRLRTNVLPGEEPHNIVYAPCRN